MFCLKNSTQTKQFCCVQFGQSPNAFFFCVLQVSGANKNKKSIKLNLNFTCFFIYFSKQLLKTTNAINAKKKKKKKQRTIVANKFCLTKTYCVQICMTQIHTTQALLFRIYKPWKYNVFISRCQRHDIRKFASQKFCFYFLFVECY